MSTPHLESATAVVASLRSRFDRFTNHRPSTEPVFFCTLQLKLLLLCLLNHAPSLFSLVRRIANRRSPPLQDFFRIRGLWSILSHARPKIAPSPVSVPPIPLFHPARRFFFSALHLRCSRASELRRTRHSDTATPPTWTRVVRKRNTWSLGTSRRYKSQPLSGEATHWKQNYSGGARRRGNISIWPSSKNKAGLVLSFACIHMQRSRNPTYCMLAVITYGVSATNP